MQPDELITRYLTGSTSDSEVTELDQLLQSDQGLRDEFLRQADLDSLLREELLQDLLRRDETELKHRLIAQTDSSIIWKWSTFAASLAALFLVAMLVISMFNPKIAMGFPTLGSIDASMSFSKDSIWAASRSGDVAMLDRQLRNGVEADQRLHDNLTALHIAVLFGQPEAVELLVAASANVELTDRKGNTPLHMASFLGRTRAVKILLAANANPLARNQSGHSVIELAAAPWNEEIERYVIALARKLETDFDLELMALERQTSLNLLLDADATELPSTPNLTIFEAAIVGDLDEVTRHINSGTDINLKEDFGGSTPLILASIYGNEQVVRLLINNGADLESRNKSDVTALHQACFFCRPKIVKTLLEAGAVSNFRNRKGKTPLEVISAEFSEELRAVYAHIYNVLNLEFNPENIEKTRRVVAQILRDHEKSQAEEQVE